MRNIKIAILDNGHIIPVDLDASTGYRGDNPVIEIAGIPVGVTDVAAMRAYNRCIILPVMHAETIIHWDKIANTKTGQIVHLHRGRPIKDEATKSARVQITLTPATLALIDAQIGPRSALIERLIINAYG